MGPQAAFAFREFENQFILHGHWLDQLQRRCGNRKVLEPSCLFLPELKLAAYDLPTGQPLHIRQSQSGIAGEQKRAPNVRVVDRSIRKLLKFFIVKYVRSDC